MPGKAVGRAAVELPWLCPNTNSLVGLAEQPASLERLAYADPAFFVFLVRFGMGEAGSPFIPPSDLLYSAPLPETAAAFLTAVQAGWLDPSLAIVSTLRRVADLAAVFARRLAEHTGRAAPEAAETAARLAPLGWYAVAAVDPNEAAACLHDPAFRDNPLECQRSWWGLDHAAVARRLAGRWRLSRRIGDVVGNLSLPFEAAVHTGSEPDLFAVVSVAVTGAEKQSARLGLSRASDRDRLLSHLGASPEFLEPIFTPPAPGPASPQAAARIDPNPYRVPLLRNLLRMAAEARRRSGAALAVRLEERIDELHRAAAGLSELAGDRLRDAKLAAVAELAAGAGHEINNPLAVISGQAQRLLRTEMDDDQADGLRSIVRQTQRISGILRDLMQFARPPKPDRQTIAAVELICEVRTDLTPVADEHEVRIEVGSLPAGVWVTADPKQVRHALAAVVRNGIEAAGRGGWVRVGCKAAGDDVWFVVEDSGPGMHPQVAEHAFDPFFCGRNAGRGRGLGLPTAWRFAERNAGDLRYEPVPGGPTRFVLTLPLAEEGVRPARKCA